MIIDYKFCNGQVTEVEVSEEIGSFILDSRHKEHLNDRRHKEHNLSLSDFFDGGLFGYEQDVSLITTDFYEALSSLSEISQRRMRLYLDGFNLTEIAEIEGVSQRAVSGNIKDSIKKIKDFLKNF